MILFGINVNFDYVLNRFRQNWTKCGFVRSGNSDGLCPGVGQRWLIIINKKRVFHRWEILDESYYYGRTDLVLRF